MSVKILSSTIVVPYRDVKENPDNPRLITDKKFEQLVESVADFPEMLYKRPLVVITAEDEKYMALGGNMRYHAIPKAIKLLRQRIKTADEESGKKWENNLELLEKGVPIMLADDWTEDQRREFIVKDNVSFGEHNWEVLANWNIEDLVKWGMEIPDITMTPTEPTEDDFEIRLPEQPVTCEGDVYQMNGHVLVCGDCRRSYILDKLFRGKKAHLSFTSPPYWVGKKYEQEKNEEEIDVFITETAAAIANNTHPDLGRIVINTGTSSINRIDKKRKVEILPLIDKWANALKLNGWLLRHLRIWVKRGQLPAIIAPRTDTIDQHNEYIASFEKEWSQILTFWEPDGDQRGQERIGTPWAQQGVWDDVHGERSAGGRHIAAFPVTIPFRNILLYTKRHEIVFDAFAGSGSSLIAAEQLDRVCYLTEISPAWCDITVQRWYDWMTKHDIPFSIKRNGESFVPTPIQ